jgi:hypothetical protein
LSNQKQMQLKSYCQNLTDINTEVQQYYIYLFQRNKRNGGLTMKKEQKSGKKQKNIEKEIVLSRSGMEDGHSCMEEMTLEGFIRLNEKFFIKNNPDKILKFTIG